jgi:2-dehydropantoate 2-reductase
MRYLIYGAGAVGGTIAARLALAGHDVVAIARGEHLRAVQRDGLRLESPEGETVVGLDAVGSVADAKPRGDDVVLLAVKSQDSAAALDELAAHAPPEIAIACVQNGVDNERQALRRFARVYGVLVYLPAEHLEPGVIRAARAPVHGVLDLGCVPAETDAGADAIAADLSSAGFASRAVADVMAWKRAKLLSNLANALDALLGDTARAARDLAERATGEALACFAAAGLAVVSDDDARARRHALSPSVAGYGHSSSWQSLARGSGSIEADYLNGEIVLLGRLHGIATPVNAALQRLANRAAVRRDPPGSLTRADLDAVLAARPA